MVNSSALDSRHPRSKFQESTVNEVNQVFEWRRPGNILHVREFRNDLKLEHQNFARYEHPRNLSPTFRLCPCPQPSQHRGARWDIPIDRIDQKYKNYQPNDGKGGQEYGAFCASNARPIYRAMKVADLALAAERPMRMVPARGVPWNITSAAMLHVIMMPATSIYLR